jgi:hypothetical protein
MQGLPPEPRDSLGQGIVLNFVARQCAVEVLDFAGRGGPDSGPDGGPDDSGPDAGLTDADTSAPDGEGGCSCSTTNTSSPTWLAAILDLVLG